MPSSLRRASTVAARAPPSFDDRVDDSEGTNLEDLSLAQRSTTAHDSDSLTDGWEDLENADGWKGRLVAAKARFQHDVKYGPLVAAVAAPISTLLDIPALSVRLAPPLIRFPVASG